MLKSQDLSRQISQDNVLSEKHYDGWNCFSITRIA